VDTNAVAEAVADNSTEDPATRSEMDTNAAADTVADFPDAVADASTPSPPTRSLRPTPSPTTVPTDAVAPNQTLAPTTKDPATHSDVDANVVANVATPSPTTTSPT
jgi:hypothetical protein